MYVSEDTYKEWQYSQYEMKPFYNEKIDFDTAPAPYYIIYHKQQWIQLTNPGPYP